MREPGRNRTTLLVVVLVILGLIAGMGLGLLFGWVVMPVKYVDTSIADLHADYKEEFILLVGSAYALDHDLAKAEMRLEQLGAPNINLWVSELASRYISEGRDDADIQAIVELAHGLGVAGPQMMAYLASPTPVPTDTPVPTPTPLPTDTPLPTNTPVPATDTPTAEPPTDTPPPPPPTDTPQPQPTATSVPPTNTPKPKPTNTPKPPPTNTPKPKPTNTPKPPAPTNTPKPPSAQSTKWTWTAWLVGPGQEGQECGGGGNLMLRVMVVDAQGKQLGGKWVRNPYTGVEQVTGHKAADPGWGIGEAEFVGAGGGKVCVITEPGGPCESGYTRDMPCWDMPPFEDMWAAGYCNCCEPNITKERCRQLVNEGKCLGAGHYTWRVVFKRSW